MKPYIIHFDGKPRERIKADRLEVKDGAAIFHRDDSERASLGSTEEVVAAVKGWSKVETETVSSE